MTDRPWLSADFSAAGTSEPLEPTEPGVTGHLVHDKQSERRWSKGRYDIIGEWLVPASLACLDGLNLKGKRLLDVATGTGTVALAAAQGGAQVTALDIAEPWLTIAGARANGAKLPLTCRKGSFHDLREFQGFDLVTSAFGVMLSARPHQAMGELFRSVRPGGLVRITAWRPNSALGEIPDAIVGLTESLPQRADPTPWSTKAGLEQLLSQDTGQLLQVESRILWLKCSSVGVIARQLCRYSPPWIALFDRVAPSSKSDALAALADHLQDFSERTPTGGMRLRLDYAVATLQRFRS
ncbi:MAG: class I SAM-dependent methyltransferase [Myxococcota bacterium]